MNLDSSLSKFGDNISKIIRGEKPFYKLFTNRREDGLHQIILKSKMSIIIIIRYAAKGNTRYF